MKIKKDKLTAVSATTEVPLKMPSEDSEPLEDPKPTKRKTVINQSGGPSWTQKSSWKNLVGEMSDSTFSLTHIFPNTASTLDKTQETNNLGTAISSDGKQKNLAKPVSNFFGEGWKSDEISKDGNQKDKVNEASSLQAVKSECGPKGEFNLFGKKSKNKNEDESVEEPNKKVKENVVAAKIPPFMRTEASQKEWLKLKKSLGGSKKRKKGEKN